MAKSSILKQIVTETATTLFARLFISLYYLRMYFCSTSQKRQLKDSTPRILGTGRADGTFKYDQKFLAEKLVQAHIHLSPSEHDKIRYVFEKTGIENCTSCCSEDLLFKNLGKAWWVEHVKQSNLRMGGEAMEKAIAAWGGDRRKITHFIWATATSSQLMPTEGLLLLKKHGLTDQTVLIPMLNIGCCSGFRAVAVANDLVRADPLNHVVLIVCAEARSSLGNAMPDPSTAKTKIQRNALVQAALFRDGASAAIIGSSAVSTRFSSRATTVSPYELAILKSSSIIIPETLEDGVATQEQDDNFIMARTIHDIPKVAAVYGVHQIMDVITSLGIRLEDCLLFFHPASYAMIHGIVTMCGLKPEQAKVSYDCVKQTGNMGGATNLYIADCWLREEPKLLSKYKYAICIAPAAGITLQLVLCEIVCPVQE